MTSDRLVEVIAELVRALSGDVNATAIALPIGGAEQTVVITAQRGMGRLLGRGGETFRALRRVISAASWRTDLSFRLVINDLRDERQIGATRDESIHATSSRA